MIKILPFLALLFSLTGIAQSLDPTYGNGGVVTNHFTNNTSSDICCASLTQPDDKIIICNNQYIARINPDGTLDTTFNTLGYKYISPVNSNGIEQLLLQPDGKIILCAQYSVLRLNSDGSTDTTFGINGTTSAALPSNNTIFNKSMTLQSDGKIVTVGYGINSTTNKNFVAVRYNTDGTLDNSFGTSGIAEFDLGTNYDYAFDVAVQSNNKIIITGQTATVTNVTVYRYDMATICVNTNGTLDTSFGNAGKVVYATNSNEFGRSIAIQSDDKIVLLGIINTGTGTGQAIYFRYNTNGTLDTSFNGVGYKTETPFFSTAIISPNTTVYNKAKIIYSQTGDLYVSGTSNNDFFIRKLYSNGSNAYFNNSNGYLTYSVNTTDYSNFINITSNGSINTGGYTLDSTTGSNKIVILSYSEYGVFQNSTLFNLRLGSDIITEIDEQPNGKAITLTNKNDIRKFNQDGSIDTSFATNGLLSISDGFYRISTQSDGKIIGSSNNSSGSSPIIYRFMADGSPDTSFGNNGIVDLSTSPVYFIDRVKQGLDGKIYVAFDYNFGNNIYGDYSVMRLFDNGTIDTSFGTNGIFTTHFNYYGGPDPTSFPEFAEDISFQHDGKIVIIGFLRNNTTNNTVTGILMLNSDGTLDNSFGTNGKTINTTFNYYNTQNIISLSSNKFIYNGSFKTSGASGNVRYNNDGSIDTTYGTNGYVTDMNLNYYMALQPDEKILKGGSQNNHFSITRYNVDGSLDTTFGNNGYLNTPINNSSRINSLALLQNGDLLAGGYSLLGQYILATQVRYTNLNLGTLSFTIQNNNVLVYPNPIESKTTFDYTLVNEELITINLYDIQGKLVKEISKDELQSIGNHKISIDLSECTTGSYILKFIASSGNQSLQLLKK